MIARPPLPPFTQETARKKAQAAENAWNPATPSGFRSHIWHILLKIPERTGTLSLKLAM